MQLDAPCPAGTLFGFVDDLSAYPGWLEMVRRADRVPAHPDDAGPAWAVELRGRLGPLTRSKRLRMVRTAWEAGRSARFERAEHDGRSHSAWVLEVEVEPLDDHRSRLDVHLHYGGSLWAPVLDRMLQDEIRRSTPRLLALVSPDPAR